LEIPSASLYLVSVKSQSLGAEPRIHTFVKLSRIPKYSQGYNPWFQCTQESPDYKEAHRYQLASNPPVPQTTPTPPSINNIKTAEPRCPTTNAWIKNVVFIHSGILLSHKEE
jgi:hypothetical protein